MPFCHSTKIYVLEVVSIRRNIIIGEEETCKITSRGQKKKRQSKGEVH
jgi:hypothetical protein